MQGQSVQPIWSPPSPLQKIAPTESMAVVFATMVPTMEREPVTGPVGPIAVNGKEVLTGTVSVMVSITRLIVPAAGVGVETSPVRSKTVGAPASGVVVSVPAVDVIVMSAMNAFAATGNCGELTDKCRPAMSIVARGGTSGMPLGIAPAMSGMTTASDCRNSPAVVGWVPVRFMSIGPLRLNVFPGLPTMLPRLVVPDQVKDEAGMSIVKTWTWAEALQVSAVRARAVKQLRIGRMERSRFLRVREPPRAPRGKGLNVRVAPKNTTPCGGVVRLDHLGLGAPETPKTSKRSSSSPGTSVSSTTLPRSGPS